MKGYWIPLIILLGIVAIALTGGAKNYQKSIQNSETVTQPVSYTYTNSSQNSTGTSNTSGSSVQTNAAYSPYKNQVTFQGGNYGGNSADQEYLQITASYSNTAPVDITGWTVYSKWSGQRVTIPSSVSLYFANSPNYTSHVYLAPGETAFLVTGHSPIGTGLHVNICSGYLSQNNTDQSLRFSPDLYTSCPAPRSEDLSSIPHNQNNVNCFDLINSLSSCKIPPVVNNAYSYECQHFLQTKLNYQACVDTHKNDANFYSPQKWYVYLNRTQTLWQNSQYEDIVLSDQNNKPIGEISR